jgi:quercetin dioxygenase-like cupin family protein
MSVRVVDLFEKQVHILADGGVDAEPASHSSRPTGEQGVIVVEPAPGVRASVGAVRLTESSRHRGERHLDGDELVYLLSGDATVSIEDDNAEPELRKLRPGEVVVIPRGRWHRLLIEAPSEMLFMTPGRTEVRLPSGG